MVWLAAALLMLWAAGRQMGLAPEVIGSGTLLIGTAPLVIYANSYVSNDVPSLFAGSLVLLLGVLTLTRPGRWMAPGMFAAGAVVATFKLYDVLAVVVMALVLAVLALRELPRPRGRLDLRSAFRWWRPRGGALLLGGLVSAVAWTIVEHRLAYIDPATLPTFTALRKTPFTLATLMQEALGILQPLTGSYHVFKSSNALGVIASPSELDFQSILATVLEWLVIAGALAGLFVSPRLRYHWLGLIGAAVLYVGGVVMGAAVFWTYKADPSIQGRYGLSVAPILVLALVASVRGKWLIRALWAFGGVTFVVSLFFMLAS